MNEWIRRFGKSLSLLSFLPGIMLVLCRKLHLFLGKSTKTVATWAALFGSNMHQIVCRQTPLGELTGLPQAVFRGPTSKGGGRREGRGGEGREEFVLCPRKKKKSRRLWISAQYQLLNGHIITAQQTDNIQRYGYGYWPSMDGLLHLVQPGRA